jgi:hypothetical protein
MNNSNFIDPKSKISELKVKNLDNEEIKLSSLWTNKTVVLVFLRHFG